MKTKFNKQENKVLSEIYRRLNYFHSGNLDTNLLLLLAYPSEVKSLIDLNIIKCTKKETQNVLNWYGLTDLGKLFFKNYITENKLSKKINAELFEGTLVIEFDYELFCTLAYKNGLEKYKERKESIVKF